MPGEKFTNVGVTYVAGTLPPSATTLNVTPGSGAVLPVLGTGEFFTLVLTSPSTGNIEVVRCTARAADTLTIERAKEPVWGKPAAALQFEDGDEVRNAPSAEWFARVAFSSQLNAESTRLDAAITAETNNRVAADALKANEADVAAAFVAAGNAVDAALLLKADLTYVDTELADAAAQSATSLDTKADKTDVDPKLEALRAAVNENTLERWNYRPPAEFPAGTSMLFHQSTPPPGWTKNTSFDDHALRITSGNVTSRTKASNPSDSTSRYGFTEIFQAAIFTEKHRLTEVQVPFHEHVSGSLTTSLEGHRHLGGSSEDRTGIPQQLPDPAYVDTPGVPRAARSGTANSAQFYTAGDAHTHTISGTTGGIDGAPALNLGHDHALKIELNYTSVIVATKDTVVINTLAPPLGSGFLVY